MIVRYVPMGNCHHCSIGTIRIVLLHEGTEKSIRRQKSGNVKLLLGFYLAVVLHFVEFKREAVVYLDMTFGGTQPLERYDGEAPISEGNSK